MLWKYRALSPLREQSAINNLMSATIPTLDYRALKQRYLDFTRPIAVDVWFALAFMPALDAITVVGSCNRPIIDHWHYFVSVRMMALASLASFIILLSGNPAAYVSQYPGMVCIFTLITYSLIGLCLDQFRAPPPKRSTNLRNWSLSEYANALSRSRGTWRAAMASTAVTCGLGTVLTALIPADWSTIIPVVTTGFEVAPTLSTFFRSVTHLTISKASTDRTPILGSFPPPTQIWPNLPVHRVRCPVFPRWCMRSLGAETGHGLAIPHAASLGFSVSCCG